MQIEIFNFLEQKFYRTDIERYIDEEIWFRNLIVMLRMQPIVRYINDAGRE